jgi:hypothetical protein
MIHVWCSRIDSWNAPVSLRTEEMLSMFSAARTAATTINGM